MKDFLFRGKSIETDLKSNTQIGEWVYGSLIIDKSNPPKKYLIFVNPKKIIRISPKTLGIYTGVRDNKNKKLFVGDIVNVIQFQFGMKSPYEIIWNTNDFGISLIHADRDGDDWGVYTSGLYLPNHQYELLGNIFDNPRKKKN